MIWLWLGRRSQVTHVGRWLTNQGRDKRSGNVMKSTLICPPSPKITYICTTTAIPSMNT